MILIITSVYANKIEVTISQKLMAELFDVTYDKYVENKPLKLNFRFVNSGNVPYKVRARLDVFKDSNHVFTGWSKEIPYKIGMDKYIEIYWYPQNTTGKFKGILRVYYATEMMDEGSIEFQVKNTELPENVIHLTDLETYDEELILTLKSDRNLEDVIIIPKNYPQGWFVGQEKIKELKKDSVERVKTEYDPSIWEPGNKITFQAITEDGKYFGENSFVMNKEGSIKTFIHYSLERIKTVFSKIYNIRK